MIWRPLSWPFFVGLLQQVAQVGAADFRGGGQGDGAPLHAFDQALLPLVEQEDDIF